MKFYWVKTSSIVKKIFGRYTWDYKQKATNAVYLTFDDGPTPDITEWTLSLLKKHNAKATFFCIGNNIQKYPKIFQQVINDGHSIGNHTFQHLNGWKTATEKYLDGCDSCQQEINKYYSGKQLLFRPPYGKLKKAQANILLSKGYKIIMWDVLSADFDQTISPDQCLKNVLKNITAGSIVIFHDSLKASINLKYVLPKVLQYLDEHQLECHKI